jgi:hypothetical protein
MQSFFSLFPKFTLNSFRFALSLDISYVRNFRPGACWALSGMILIV